ncbi:MAG: glycosyltransferase family 4 protein [Rhizobiaceae bacterium]
MRVLYFHQYFSTPDGRTGTRSYELARRLVDQGVGVTLVCGSFDLADSGLQMPYVKGVRRGNVDGIDVVQLDAEFSNKQGIPKRLWNFFKFSFRMSAYALKENYDLAFATSTPLTIAFPALVARWIKRKKMVFEVRDLWPEMPKAMGIITNPILLKAAELLEWSAYRSAHHCVGLSPGIVEGIAAKGVPQDSITIIPNGADLELADAVEASDAKDIIKQAKINPKDKLAVFTGAHGRANGLDALLEAAQVLQARGQQNIHLLLLGDGSEKERLIERAKQMQLTNVTFLPPVPKRQLFALLKRADLGLMFLANVPAFYRGTSPNKFFDYLSCGLPTLVNYPGWMAQLVQDENCGYVAKPDDPNHLADVLTDALADSTRSTKGNAARALAEREFNRDLMGQRFVDLICKTAR